MKAKHIVGIVFAVAAIGGLTYYSGLFDPPRRVKDVERASAERRVKLRRGGIKEIKPADVAVREVLERIDLTPVIEEHKRKIRVPIVNPDDIFAHLKGEDRKRAEALQTASDNGVFKEVVKEAKKSLKSENPEIRGNAVDALGWFGAEALPELTLAMADADDEVASAATHQWELAVSEIEDCEERFAIATAAMPYISDEDALFTISAQISDSATEYIDGEEDEARQFEKRVEVIQSLVDIIESGRSAAAAAAREAYLDITGNEWHGVDEAEIYLSDPENYTPPDEREGEEGDGEETETESEEGNENQVEVDGTEETKDQTDGAEAEETDADGENVNSDSENNSNENGNNEEKENENDADTDTSGDD